MTREEAAMKLSFHMMQCGLLMPLGWIDNNGEGSELFEAVRMAQDALRERPILADCAGCRWRGVRPQKCACCARNANMKDNYEVGA